MKIIIIALLTFTSTLIMAEEAETILKKKHYFGFFSKAELKGWGGQCGCWYYYPFYKKANGKVIALGERVDNGLYMIIDGKKTMIGHWMADYHKTYHSILYRSNKYKINIHSKIIKEGKYSSDFESAITVQSDDKRST